MVGGTVKRLDRADITVQGAIGLGGASAIIRGVAGDARIRPELAADGRPAVVDRIQLSVIVRIKFVTYADLLLVAHALDLKRLGLGSGQSRKQQAGEDGDNRDNHQ